MENYTTDYNNWTFYVRPGTGKRILLLLHGFTGDENSMMLFAKNLPMEYWILSPRAPYPANPKGYSWRESVVTGSWPGISLFRSSVFSLVEMIKSWACFNHLDTTNFDVAGFSQGGAMAFSLCILFPNLISKSGILAGFAPDGCEELIRPGLLGGKKIFMAHGTSDMIVPFDKAERTEQYLLSAGAEVIFCRSSVGHKLSADCLRSFEKYFEL